VERVCDEIVGGISIAQAPTALQTIPLATFVFSAGGQKAPRIKRNRDGNFGAAAWRPLQILRETPTNATHL